MPELLRVHEAHPKIIHCIIKIGYRIKNGGLGTVAAIAMLQAMLITHAEISNINLKGHSR